MHLLKYKLNCIQNTTSDYVKLCGRSKSRSTILATRGNFKNSKYPIIQHLASNTPNRYIRMQTLSVFVYICNPTPLKTPRIKPVKLQNLSKCHRKIIRPRN